MRKTYPIRVKEVMTELDRVLTETIKQLPEEKKEAALEMLARPEIYAELPAEELADHFLICSRSKSNMPFLKAGSHLGLLSS